MGIKRSVLQNLIQRSKGIVKIFKNVRSLGELKWKKLGKSQNQLFFLVFQLELGHFSLFCKTIFFPLNMAWKDGCFVEKIDIF